MAGWDRPMFHFYLTIFDMREDAPEEVVWSSVHAPDPVDATSTERFRRKLIECGLRAPNGFWELVEKREGNVIRRLLSDTMS